MKHETQPKAMSAASASISRRRSRKETHKRNTAILKLFNKQTETMNTLFGIVLDLDADHSDSAPDESEEHESDDDSEESKTPRF